MEGLRGGGSGQAGGVTMARSRLYGKGSAFWWGQGFGKGAGFYRGDKVLVRDQGSGESGRRGVDV